MTDQTLVAVAAQFASEDEAVAAFEQLRAHYKESGHEHGEFDAAVINRDRDGSLSIVKRADSKGTGKKGLAIGLAGGLTLALFPAVALGGALLVGGGGGAAVDAVAKHFSRKNPSKDLETISETLEAGSAGIVFVLEPSDADEVESLLTGASKVTRTELAVDEEELDKSADGAYE